MGEVTVRGKAERTVRCDTVDYSIRFRGEGNTASEAAEAATSETENFLAALQEMGVSPDMFELAGNETNKNYRSSDSEPLYSAVRSIALTMKLSTANSAELMRMIAGNKFNIEYSESYSCSYLAKVHRELLEEAINDSKAQAEIIAACAGQKITGIERIEAGAVSKYDKNERCSGVCLFSAKSPGLADKLSEPVTVEEESVTVVWRLGE